MIDVVLDVSGIYGLGPSHEAIRAAASAAKGNDKTGNSTQAAETSTSDAPADEMEAEDQDSAYDSESASVIRLSNGMVSKRSLVAQQPCALTHYFAGPLS